MQQQINHIKHLVELALGHKIKVQPNAKDLLQVDPINSVDELALIKHYLNNPDLVNEQLISGLVDKQLKKYSCAEKFDLHVATCWNEYLLKLEQLLEQVQYRKDNNFEYNDLMPTKQQLAQLQEECWELTQKWYGVGNGNIACFYRYFVAMSQAAGITCFEYPKIGKFISPDRYIVQINANQRRSQFEQHTKNYQEFLAQGGNRALGRSPIDATAMANVLYFKSAQLRFNWQLAKKILTAALDLENYGQAPLLQRTKLWNLLQQHYPDNTTADQKSIFYHYMQYLNATPGEYFNYFAADLPEVNKVSPKMFHDIVKIAGLQSGHLILFSRDIVDNWIPKRMFNLKWVRKYDLKQINDKQEAQIMRKAGAIELARFLPNELPYAPGHGISLCGDGLIDGIDQRGTVAYEWNTPDDEKIDLDNWPRDIEKIFREFKFFCPAIKYKPILLGEKLFTMFHNSMAYSTIHATQHTHIFATGYESFLIYNLPASEIFEVPNLKARFEFVQVGSEYDAFFLRIHFGELENEPLIKFLLDLTDALFIHFGGMQEIDIHLQLLATEDGTFVFTYEPHAFLLRLENDRFLNPYNQQTSPRRPQFLQPEGKDIAYMAADNEMAGGEAYCRTFFDATCKPGTRKYITEFSRKIHQ